MAFKDFWLRKNLLFPDEEHTSVTSKKMAKRWSPESTLLFVRVLRIGYEISDWMVPVDPASKLFSQAGLTADFSYARPTHSLPGIRNQAALQVLRVDRVKPRVIC